MHKRAKFGFMSLAVAALLLPDCSGGPLPGSILGTYKVIAQAETNSCGLGMPDPWTFDVQLSQDRTTLYWSRMDGSPSLFGPLNAQSAATLTATQQANVDGTADAGLGPCTMDRADNIQVVLGNGSPPANFTGTISYLFSVSSGSDCSDQLATVGGQYSALPCTITYSATASRQ